MFVHGDGKLRQWMAGFGAPYAPSLNIDKKLINSVCAHSEAIRDGAGPDVRLMIDLNFNARTEGYVSMIRALKDFDFLWVELDSYNTEALPYIRQQHTYPISGLKTFFEIE